MISSEVQRTLVKSPPELWAEISDPAALARHLGEFGEIRITRVEPEQRVEWQAGDTSGSVVIKPSGWGTKVKLTVTRELAEAEAGAESDGQPQDEAKRQDLKVGEIAEPDARGAEAEAGAEACADEASDSGASEPEQPIQSIDEPQLRGADEPALAAGAELEQADVEQAAFEQAEPEDVAARQADDYAERQAAPEPRRGFFARLFGRRRAAAAVAPIDQPEAPRESAREAMQPARYNALAVWASQIEAADGAGGSHALAGTGAADAHAASADAAAEAEQEVAQAPALPPAPALAPAPSLAPSPVPGDGQSAETPIEPSPPAAASPDASADEPDAAALGQKDAPADISAEIRQAEEVAAEQVTAVLSGVLDRLGAAHHRPFSRA